MKILITGGAGFIGAVIAAQLLVRGDTVVVINNRNDYYEVSLKQARLHHLQHNRSQSQGNFSFLRQPTPTCNAWKHISTSNQQQIL